MKEEELSVTAKQDNQYVVIWSIGFKTLYTAIAVFDTFLLSTAGIFALILCKKPAVQIPNSEHYFTDVGSSFPNCSVSLIASFFCFSDINIIDKVKLYFS